MTAFYTENSYGQFTVAAGPSGIGGWYTASDTHDHYGTNGAGFDDFPAELVIEAQVVVASEGIGVDGPLARRPTDHGLSRPRDMHIREHVQRRLPGPP